VQDGLIHDWIGIVCIPGKTVAKTLALLQDYDNHKNIYQPEVIGSKLIGRQDNDWAHSFGENIVLSVWQCNRREETLPAH
jgi:hypothetical protein